MPRLRTETQLKEKLRTRLGYPPGYFRRLWKALKEGGLIAEYLAGESDLRDLVNEARRRHKDAEELSRADRRRGRTKRPSAVPMLGTAEIIRAGALSGYLARLADGRPDVQGFRQKHLSQCLLLRRAALEFLRYPRAGVPVTANENVLPVTVNGSQRAVRAGRQALRQLRTLAYNLAKDFPWPVGDAAWFVLTGDVPFVNPVILRKATVEICSAGGPKRDPVAERTIITITADAWVSAETVTSLFRSMQKVALKGDNRSLDRKSIQVFGFVNALIRRSGKRPPWPTILEEWNHIQRRAAKRADEKASRGRKNVDPRTMMFKDHRNLATVYRRVHKAIVGVPPTPDR